MLFWIHHSFQVLHSCLIWDSSVPVFFAFNTSIFSASWLNPLFWWSKTFKDRTHKVISYKPKNIFTLTVYIIDCVVVYTLSCKSFYLQSPKALLHCCASFSFASKKLMTSRFQHHLSFIFPHSLEAYEILPVSLIFWNTTMNVSYRFSSSFYWVLGGSF
jgi:hypothetical protein